MVLGPSALEAVIAVTAVGVQGGLLSLLEVRSLFIGVNDSSTLMRLTRTRAFALLTIALLWAITPAMACVLPGATMTPTERECCHHMAEQCGITDATAKRF
ncbi:MAG: hypothetical protein DMG76_03935 [Acidobacteria bacterium]|nr:MAG: hypothetical protein DMG76_03935 [Acidobacteriota bacterium]